jgi:hypothetical protein
MNTIKLLLIIALIVPTNNSYADTPGKAKMSDSKVVLEGLNQFSTYQFFAAPSYKAAFEIKDTNNTITIPASGGAPNSLLVWAISKVTNASTDTLTFNNYYDANKVVTVSAIENNKIVHSIQELSNNNVVINGKISTRIEDETIVAEAEKINSKNKLKNGLLVSAAILGLGGLIYFFMKRKDRNSNV